MKANTSRRQRLTVLVGVTNSVTEQRLIGAEIYVDGVKFDEPPNEAGLYRIPLLSNRLVEVAAIAAGFRSARVRLSARDSKQAKVDLVLDPHPAAEAAAE